MLVPTCNASTRRIEAGQLSSIQDHPGLHGKFQASMDSIVRHCIKEKGRQEEVWEKEVKNGGSGEREHLFTDRGNWQMLMS